MDDVERDGCITINIGFGNLTYDKDATGSFARATVDLAIDNVSGPADRLEIALRIASTPETDTILDLVERSRTRLASLLRTAADHFDRETAETLLYATGPAGSEPAG